MPNAVRGDKLSWVLKGGEGVGRVPEPHRSPKAPEERAWSWHGTDEARKGDEILEHGGWQAFADAHAWYAPTTEDQDSDQPKEKEAYKLPHHEIVEGRLRVVWNGVKSAMQVLAGARGGVDIPKEDRKAVYQHLARHYEEFGKEPPRI
jgi:hypothetical protein